MIDFVLFAIAVASIIIAAATAFYFKKKNLRLIAEIGQLSVDKQIIAEQLASEVMKNQVVENNDGFLRFISESRDWAFQYIEEAQGTIRNIINKNKIDNDDLQALKRLLPDSVEND